MTVANGPTPMHGGGKDQYARHMSGGADVPCLLRFEDKVSWLRSEYDLAYGHAKAIVHEYDLRRAARRLG